MNKIRTSLFSILILVLLLTNSVVYAAGGVGEIGSASQSHCSLASVEYAVGSDFSADDFYDPAALASIEDVRTLDPCLAVSTPSESANAIFLAANPEVRYALSPISFLQANPEVRYADQAGVNISSDTSAALLATNPEIRYALPSMSFLQANPEVRYADQDGVNIGSDVSSASLAANPEISAILRYLAAQGK